MIRYQLENQSQERVAFGKPLTGLQQVRHTLAEVKTDCMFSRVVTDQLIEAYANDDMDQQTVSMAKVKLKRLGISTEKNVFFFSIGVLKNKSKQQ